MTRALFLAQRGTAVVLAFAVVAHLSTILYAAQTGITASRILARTQGNYAFLLLYVTFVLAAAVHAPIGLRNIAREWLGWSGRGLDAGLAAVAVLLAALGLRAAAAVFVA